MSPADYIVLSNGFQSSQTASRHKGSKCFNFLNELNNFEGSKVWPLSALVKAFQEVGFPCELSFFKSAEPLVALHGAACLWCDLIQNDRAPHVTLLNVVEAFVACPHETVNLSYVTHFVMLAPVLGEVEFGHLGVCILRVALPANHKRHVSTVLAEQTQRLEVGFGERAGFVFRKSDELMRRIATYWVQEPSHSVSILQQ